MTDKPAGPTDWKTEPLPAERTTIALDRLFSPREMDRIRVGCIPEMMEDKWFVYWQDDTLYFHRSWTGYCIYVVHFVRESEAWRMVRADVNRDYEQYQYTNDDYDARMISYLIDLLLLHRPADFPDSPTEDDDSDASGLRQWATVGRASLGTHPNDRNDRDE